MRRRHRLPLAGLVERGPTPQPARRDTTQVNDPEKPEDVNTPEAEAERVEEAIEYFTKVGKDDTPDVRRRTRRRRERAADHRPTSANAAKRMGLRSTSSNDPCCTEAEMVRSTSGHVKNAVPHRP